MKLSDLFEGRDFIPWFTNLAKEHEVKVDEKGHWITMVASEKRLIAFLKALGVRETKTKYVSSISEIMSWARKPRTNLLGDMVDSLEDSPQAEALRKKMSTILELSLSLDFFDHLYQRDVVNK